MVGAVLRIAAAWTGYGIFASDDYSHVIEIAWDWLSQPELPFNSRIRSELAARWAWLVFLGAQAVGIDGPVDLIRTLYTVLGLYSLVAIPGAYSLALHRFGPATAKTAAWLMAAEAVIPRLSTRALLSMMSIPPLVWGLVFLDRARDPAPTANRNAFVGALLVGAASLFRFQLGIIFLIACGFVLAAHWRGRPLKVLTSLVAGGLIAGFAQLGLDYHAFGSWTPAPWLYVQYNMQESSSFGVGPWYSYFGMFILLTLPPATFALAPGLWAAAKRAPLLSVSIAVFFVSHSLIPHKEERFLFPLLPLFFVLMAHGLVVAWNRGRWRRGLVRTFWALNAVLLVGATVSDANRNVTTPMLEAGRSGSFTTFYAIGYMLVPRFYLSDGPTRAVSILRVDSFFEHLDKTPPTGKVRILFDRTPSEENLSDLYARARCDPPSMAYGDPVDRLLVWVNPIGNKRRRGPKTVIDCTFANKRPAS